MISWIMRLRGALPPPLWRRMRDWYWRRFWNEAANREEKIHGVRPSDLALGERGRLIEALSDLYPWGTALEVGCAYGQNFHIIAPLFPRSRFVGIDRDEKIVKDGQAYLQEKSILNTTLITGDAQNLEFLPDKSFDIVYSCAFFLYVRPEDVGNILREMIRVARRAVLLMEQHREVPPGSRETRELFIPRENNLTGYWIRDYLSILLPMFGRERVQVTKVPGPIWSAERWTDLAHLIEVDVRPQGRGGE